MTANVPYRTFDENFPNLDGKSILITGGTGSFGHGFIREILNRYTPSRLIIFSRDELKQSDMAAEFKVSDHPSLRYVIGAVRDRDRLEMAMHSVDIVIHAAALKQVPAAEYNPMECIHTNVLGAENIVHAALRTGVKQVIALSTDKAANPINLYGASKLASDKIFVAANNLGGETGTRFSVVRYGNVIGSRGSVVPLYEKLVREGADSLPVTDPRMTRFWITLEQGVNFVLSCLEIMKGGEIFVPKIPSMTITDIATAIAPDLPQRTVGIRPGEKLHEVMISEDDSRTTSDLGDRYVIMPVYHFWVGDEIMQAHGTPVADGFSYTSDANDEWLGPEVLLELMDKTNA